jgi:hypothetical protein
MAKTALTRSLPAAAFKLQSLAINIRLLRILPTPPISHLTTQNYVVTRELDGIT